jgi:ferredoxin--NADP+ reductase
MRAAVVGAGPSGFYTTDQLLKAGFEVDLYDKLPTPYGLVRAGVAPDHPKIKSVTRVYDKVAGHERFRFYGGVELGVDVTSDELVERYHAVVYTIGTARDNRLGIPGEDLDGSIAATDFVAWYNGHPAYADHAFDLTSDRAVVIGNGNVAIDVARMLMLDERELTPTDTADHAIDAFAASSVREVVLLGRRGPAQAAFTNPELLELGELDRGDVVVDPRELELDDASGAWLASDAASKTAQRNVEILRDYAERGMGAKTHRIVLRFLSSPVEILGDDTGRVTGVRIVRNRIEAGDAGHLEAVSTGDEEVIECGLVVRSIGYRGDPLPGIPFDERRGLIRNTDGRVVGEDGVHRRGEYTAGWIKRGPSGVIGTNKKCAADTVGRIIEDRDAGALPAADGDADDTERWLRERVERLVTWEGWLAIDAQETAAGEPFGRPRVKLVRTDDLHAAAAPYAAARSASRNARQESR